MESLNKYIKVFIAVYMCELEQYLQKNSKELAEISFQSDEANTDRPLKEYLKNVIEQKCNKINNLSEISKVKINIDGAAEWHEIDENIRNIYIQCVLLPNELTEEIKQKLRARKNAVYTNPDLCLELNVHGEIIYETIELKSTKGNDIPGSSVQQVDPCEWVIFIKHTNNSVNVCTGQYIHAVNSHIQFPDRSPRPQISFSELYNWNQHNRIIDDNNIVFSSAENEQEKYKLISDWQSVLAERWVKIVFSYKKREREPWFNGVLKKFILQFICEYEKMSFEQKAKYVEMLKKLIK